MLEPEWGNTAPTLEIVLREDCGNGDLSYPWAAVLLNHRALVVYYFNVGDGTRFFSGRTLLSLD